jgi:hypothetical protein
MTSRLASARRDVVFPGLSRWSGTVGANHLPVTQS